MGAYLFLGPGDNSPTYQFADYFESLKIPELTVNSSFPQNIIGGLDKGKLGWRYVSRSNDGFDQYVVCVEIGSTRILRGASPKDLGVSTGATGWRGVDTGSIASLKGSTANAWRSFDNATILSGYSKRFFNYGCTISWSLASGLSVTPRKSASAIENIQFAVKNNGSSARVYCANIGAGEDRNYVDLEVSGINNGFSAYIADYGGDDPQRFEVVEGRFVRIYLFGGGVYFGDCNIAIGQRFVGSTVVVTPQCSDPSLAPQVPNLGEYTVDARKGGSVISVGSSVDPSTGALSVTLPQGASLSVSYAIKADYSRLWYLDEQSAVVVNIASGTDTDTPVEYTFKVARRALYSIKPSPNPPSGQSTAFRVVSPASPDVVESGIPYYIGGTDIAVKALLGEEEDLSVVYLDDLNNVNFASYTKEGGGIDGDSVTIRGISRSCYVRGIFTTRQYGVSCAADDASADAFSAFSVTAGGEPVESAEKGGAVTFSATPDTDYAFEGFYLGGEKLDGAAVDPSTGVATLTIEIEGETRITAKAKVEVSLGASGSGNLIIDGAVVTTPYTRDVTLGESFWYSARPVGENIHFLLWYESDLVTPVYGYGASGTIAPTAPLVMVAKFDTIDPTKEIVASVGYVERNTGREGTVLIDGEEVSSAVRLAGDTVVFLAKPRNGWVFGGWFDNPAGQGTPVSKDAEISFLAYLHSELYALFEVNTHAICEWEGTAEPKELVWRSKTYEASKPFNPSACRVDALGYRPTRLLDFTVDMFSAPDVNAKPTASTTLVNIASQDARRLPVRRMERYMQIEVKANVEVDALLAGTSMEGLAI